jgi:hypothetical protein
MTQKISIFIAFLTGLGMIFIGARFLVAPGVAEAGYGLNFHEQGDFSFHYIKGIRDVFTGALLCLFVWSRQTKALGAVLAVGTIIPIVDLFIVVNKGYNGVEQAMPHIAAIAVCSVVGTILWISKTSPKAI